MESNIHEQFWALKESSGSWAMLRTELLTGFKAFDSLAPRWRELATNSISATPFQTWEWQSLWLKHYGVGKAPRVLAVFEGEDLVGIASFVVSSGLWRTLRWLGGGPSDYLQPLARTGQEFDVSQLVAEYLNEVRGVDLVDLQQVRETTPLVGLLTNTPKIEQATCLCLDLPNSFDEYLKLIGKSLRYDVRKLDKDLFKSGKATIEEFDATGISGAFEIFLEQHKARWRERKLPGAFVGRSVRFHREWVEIAAKRNWLDFKVLRHEGQPAGAIYAMRFGETLYYYQAGFDPEHKAISPGTLLVAQCIRDAIEQGLSRLDFMRGDEPYKRRWKPQHAYKNSRTIWHTSDLRGSIGERWNRSASEVELKVRARLEGGSLA